MKMENLSTIPKVLMPTVLKFLPHASRVFMPPARRPFLSKLMALPPLSLSSVISISNSSPLSISGGNFSTSFETSNQGNIHLAGGTISGGKIYGSSNPSNSFNATLISGNNSISNGVIAGGSVLGGNISANANVCMNMNGSYQKNITKYGWNDCKVYEPKYTGDDKQTVEGVEFSDNYEIKEEIVYSYEMDEDCVQADSYDKECALTEEEMNKGITCLVKACAEKDDKGEYIVTDEERVCMLYNRTENTEIPPEYKDDPKSSPECQKYMEDYYTCDGFVGGTYGGLNGQITKEGNDCSCKEMCTRYKAEVSITAETSLVPGYYHCGEYKIGISYDGAILNTAQDKYKEYVNDEDDDIRLISANDGGCQATVEIKTFQGSPQTAEMSNMILGTSSSLTRYTTTEATPSCPTGYTLNGNLCQNTNGETVPPTYTCDASCSLSGTSCRCKEEDTEKVQAAADSICQNGGNIYGGDGINGYGDTATAVNIKGLDLSRLYDGNILKRKLQRDSAGYFYESSGGNRR